MFLKAKIWMFRENIFRGKTAVISACIAFGVGIYDGFYGPGTGTFLLLLLTGLAHLELNKAAGVTKAINLTTNISALVVFVRTARYIFHSV